MPPLHQLSTAQLRQALQLSEQIDTMQQKLEAILGGPEPVESAARAKTKGKAKGSRGGKRTMSAEGREKIAAAARARWAKVKAGAGKSAASAVTAKPGKAKTVATKPGRVAKRPAASAAVAPKKKRAGLTDEGRAKLAAAMKARWEARKKGTPGAAV